MTTATQTAPTPATQTAPAPLPAGRVPAAPLRAAVTHLARIVPARHRTTITNVLMQAQGGSLSLTASNLEMEWRTTLDAPDLPDLTASVHAGRLSQITALLGKQRDVPLGLLRATKPQLELYAEEAGTLLRLPTDDPQLHPLSNPDTDPFAAPMPADAATIPADELVTAIRAVTYASSTEAFQAVFRGICFALRGDIPEIVASDGYRVAMYRLSTPLPYAIIPRTALNLLLPRLAAQPEGEPVRIASLTLAPPTPGQTRPLNATTLRFQFGAEDVVVKCTDSDFPDYDRVLPRGQQVTGEWARGPLLARLRALRVMADRNANSRIELTQTGTLLTMRTEGDYGEAISALDLSVPLGGAASISAAYNLSHLIDAAQFAPGELLRVGIKVGKEHHDRLMDVQCGNYRAVLVSLRA